MKKASKRITITIPPALLVHIDVLTDENGVFESMSDEERSPTNSQRSASSTA